jgi:hypothetical protein
MDAMDSGLFGFQKYGYFVVRLYNGHRTHTAVNGRTPEPSPNETQSLQFTSYRLAAALPRTLSDTRSCVKMMCG